jgi:hypothetical protein
MSEKPKELYRNKLKIINFEFDIIVLDNGQRLITEESLKKFLSLTGMDKDKNIKQLMEIMSVEYE